MNILLKNCRLIPELSYNRKINFGNILIRQGKIEYIDSENNIESYLIKEDISIDKEFDCEGRTLLPGFFELHTHLCLDSCYYAKNLLYSDNELLIKSYEFAKEYIKQGYTTVRDCGARGNVVSAIRDAIDKGILVGPRIYCCGQILTPTETGNESFGKMYVEVDSKDDMKREARKQYKLGNDFTKVMVTGAFLNKAADPGMLIMTEEELKSCVEVASLKKSYVAAHCHGDEGIKLALKCGVRTLEHCAFIKEDTVKAIKDNGACFIIPTAAIGMEWTSDNVDENDHSAMVNKHYENIEKECINRAYNMGVEMGFGSDIDMEAFKRVVGYEFIARKEFYNFKNIDILKQATIISAKILGLDKELGSIDEGKLADLVLVDGNPDEDMNVMRKLPLMVFKEGEKIDVI